MTAGDIAEKQDLVDEEKLSSAPVAASQVSYCCYKYLILLIVHFYTYLMVVHFCKYLIVLHFSLSNCIFNASIVYFKSKNNYCTFVEQYPKQHLAWSQKGNRFAHLTIWRRLGQQFLPESSIPWFYLLITDYWQAQFIFIIFFFNFFLECGWTVSELVELTFCL